MKVSLPERRRPEHHTPALPAPHSQSHRQTRRTHHLLLNASLPEAGPLRRRSSGPLCTRLRRVHPFHLAHSPLSGFNRASHSEVGARTSRHQASKPQIRSRATQWSKTAAAALAVQNEEAKLYSQHQLEEIATETSEAERRANGAERELMDWKTAQFMEQHLGEEYDALIISVQKYGCFVELFEVFRGRLAPHQRPGRSRRHPCRFSRRRSRHRLATRRRRQAPRRPSRNSPGRGRGTKPKQLTWSLGDKVRVRAERIDPMRKRVEFALVSPS